MKPPSALLFIGGLAAACAPAPNRPRPPGDPLPFADSATDEGADAAGGDLAGGDEVPTCSVAGLPGTCTAHHTCVGAVYLADCGGPPALACCLADAVACSVAGAPGACVDTAACPASWSPTPGLCPGAANIQCCTEDGAACAPESRPQPNAGLVEQAYTASCPDGMLLVDVVCVDRFEAALVEVDAGGAVLGSWSPYVNPGATLVRAVSLAGAIPQGYVNADQAEAACARAGKRLCTDTEWLRACRGSAATTYPYGNTRQPGVCNDARARHPAIEYFGTSDAWIWSELGNACINQIPEALAPTGEHPGCVSEEGLVDLMGNLHEWTADPNGTFRGGFYADTAINGEGCLYATTAHNRSHWDYSTGFRCCAAPL